MVRDYRPDIVLCDIGLPGIDGDEVARAFRNDDALRGTFLVALSGYATPEDVRRASRAGFDQHIAKPPTVEKLDDVLAKRPCREKRYANGPGWPCARVWLTRR